MAQMAADRSGFHLRSSAASADGSVDPAPAIRPSVVRGSGPLISRLPRRHHTRRSSRRIDRDHLDAIQIVRRQPKLPAEEPERATSHMPTHPNPRILAERHHDSPSLEQRPKRLAHRGPRLDPNRAHPPVVVHPSSSPTHQRSPAPRHPTQTPRGSARHWSPRAAALPSPPRQPPRPPRRSSGRDARSPDSP